jgi:cytochrome c biogenesis protein
MKQRLSHSFAKAVYELLSSMRFAISLLTVLAIASVIGTVLKQNEAYANYIVEFGQFWFKLFAVLGLYDVYHAGWFLVILSFLVLSTGFCIYRQAPLMLREMRSFREHATETSLRSFAHRAELPTGLGATAVLERLGKYLTAQGYRFKQTALDNVPGGALIAAKSGGLNRLGYILTHGAIVIICVGGLMDGNVPLKIEELLGYKKIETRDIPEAAVPAVSRLSPANLSFRGSVSIPEGGSANVVFLNVRDGYLVQDLPFEIGLKKFRIEHYPTGQPKSFESDIVVIDRQANKTFTHTISVNHPLIYKGIAIYQASFGDGGSRLALTGWSLFSPQATSFPFKGVVNRSSRLSNGDTDYQMEITDFRAFNIQDMGGDEPTEAQPQGMWQSVQRAIQAGTTTTPKKTLHNVGPSFQFKLRDAQGQAKEYQTYMAPIQLENRWFLVSGMRNSPAESFRYLRFPMDEDSSIAGFMGLRAVLFDRQAYPEIGRRFAASALQGEAVGDTLRAKLVESTARVLEMFAHGGYDALAQFIERSVPQAEQEKAAETYLKILERAAFEAYQLSRERAGKKPASPDVQSLQFVRDSLNAVNDTFFYGAPVFFQLNSYDEVLASGLQLTRSPGKNIVYLGSVLLVLGVFVMFYIRERRIWLLVKPEAGEVLFAMSSNRKTMDFEKDFDRHRNNLADLLKG